MTNQFYEAVFPIIVAANATVSFHEIGLHTHAKPKTFSLVISMLKIPIPIPNISYLHLNKMHFAILKVHLGKNLLRVR